MNKKAFKKDLESLIDRVGNYLILGYRDKESIAKADLIIYEHDEYTISKELEKMYNKKIRKLKRRNDPYLILESRLIDYIMRVIDIKHKIWILDIALDYSTLPPVNERYEELDREIKELVSKYDNWRDVAKKIDIDKAEHISRYIQSLISDKAVEKIKSGDYEIIISK